VADVSRPATFQAIYLGDAVSYLIPAAILLTLPHAGRRLAPDAAEVADQPTSGGYRQVFADRAFMRFFIYGLALTTCGYAQVEVGFTAFSTEVAQVAPRVIAWALAGNTLLIVVAQLLVLRWLDGRSRSTALAIAGVIFAASWLALAAAGYAGQRGAAAAAVAGVVGCAVIFAAGEMLLAPVMPALTNALATDELRGRYNALGSMVWGISGVIGPVAAGPLIGAGHPAVWVVLVVGGCLGACVLALGLRGRLTPEQDGRTGHPAPDVVPDQALTGASES
jgi:MFS family permease